MFFNGYVLSSWDDFESHPNYPKYFSIFEIRSLKILNEWGRLYNPILGRMLSPDNFVQMPDFTQNFNRYSYCLNNPLIYTDPSGELFLWDDLIVGGAGFLTGYLTHGFSSGNWGWDAVKAGGIWKLS